MIVKGLISSLFRPPISSKFAHCSVYPATFCLSVNRATVPPTLHDCRVKVACPTHLLTRHPVQLPRQPRQCCTYIKCRHIRTNHAALRRHTYSVEPITRHRNRIFFSGFFLHEKYQHIKEKIISCYTITTDELRLSHRKSILFI